MIRIYKNIVYHKPNKKCYYNIDQMGGLHLTRGHQFHRRGRRRSVLASRSPNGLEDIAFHATARIGFKGEGVDWAYHPFPPLELENNAIK